VSALRRIPRARRRGHPLAVAAIVILAVAALTFYAFNRSLPFVHRFTLHALVTNSVNVRSGSPVRIAGIDVGSVQGVQPAGDASEIAFTVDDSGLPVHKDATIRIRDRLFLEGNYYLELDPGTPSAPVIQDGGTIPLSQTASPVQFYSVLSTFDLALRGHLANLSETFDQGFDAQPGQPLTASGASGLKQAIPQLTPVTKDIALIDHALQGTHPTDVQNLLSSTSQVTGTLASSSALLVDLVSSLNATSNALAAADGALAQSISALDQTLRIAPSSLDAVDRALSPLGNLAEALDPSLRRSPPILDSLIGTVNQLGIVLAPTPRGQLLSSLKVAFVMLPRMLSEVGRAFPSTRQVTDCLQTHVIPLLGETVPDGTLSSGRPVWQDFVHFLPGFAGATGSFDADGPYTRVLGASGAAFMTGPTIGGQQIVSTLPPNQPGLLGARPAWVGQLTPSAFHPEVPCATQPLPGLGSRTSPPDLHPASTAVLAAPSAAPDLARLRAVRAPAPGAASRARERP